MAGYPLQSIGTDPNWTSRLSPDFAFWQKINHEMSERQMEAEHPGWSKLTSSEQLNILLADLKKDAETEM